MREFDRNLVSLIQCIKKENIKGIVVGRAEINCNMNLTKWELLFKTKKELQNIPIVVNVDFGHTNPIVTNSCWWKSKN
jgi:muramoyltetrapeptide carboxypeptidase